MLPPLAVLIVSAALATIALNMPFEFNNTNLPPSPSNLSPLFTPEIQYWSGSITQWAAASNLDPNLVAVIMQIESCGNLRAQSRAGAMGLFQVMPFHFYAIDNPYNPDTNAARGLAYLQKSLETAGGNARLALAGYNGGIGVIGRAEWTWPAETKRYVQYGSPIYEDAINGAASSSMLDEWYNQYGASLCKQARENLGLP
jgi:soluble lytic murein transglycosylase-like protein